MWKDLNLPWRACLELAWEAYCDDCYPIGAVVTGPDEEILSCGRNHVYPKRLWKKPMAGVDLAHAEMEALLSLDYCGIDPHACSLYTSLEPCPMCMSTFYMSGLRTLHFAAREPYSGSAELLGKTRYLGIKHISVSGPYRELEVILIAIVMEPHFAFHAGFLPNDPNQFYEIYFQKAPEGMALAEKLFQLNFLEELRENKTPAEEVYERLYKISIKKSDLITP